MTPGRETIFSRAASGGGRWNILFVSYVVYVVCVYVYG